ncbi:disulfide oxidoreductase [Ferviditalea candida]|uniref:Disulfide oxidoreductase n=1 Tax=Ferviditalea candida TaxID=3108399 RepID=A0ABU5ZCQ0_9BACL|nr:disulfide oxidoreductase [Paenibacillaceae bacterium T2]
MKFRKFLLANGLHAAWAISLIATLGSLYLSEILGYAPCKLCWMQRIFMYPQVILLGIAAVRKDYGQWKYVLPLTLIGAGISIYHYGVQKLPWLKEGGTACGIIPCNIEYINVFGFITIPFLAGTAFILISLIVWLTGRASK